MKLSLWNAKTFLLKNGLIVFIQDITERKLAEKDCKELNTKLEIRNRIMIVLFTYKN
jgi:hypothetical protein